MAPQAKKKIEGTASRVNPTEFSRKKKKTPQNFPEKKRISRVKFPVKKTTSPRKISRKKNDLSRILEFHYAV